MYHAYIRVSTDHQHVANQKHEILTFATANHITIDKWLEEVISSRKSLKDRKLNTLLKKLKKGDVLIATEISRLGRNLLEIMTILQKCMEKDCQIWTLKENYRLGGDLQSHILAFAFGLASQLERQLISDRTKNSLRRLKDEGKKLGRPHGFTYSKLKQNHQKIKALWEKNLSIAEIARLMDCTWITAARYIKGNFKPIVDEE